MASFITRVELHGASGGDYETLHRDMASRGFTRQIVGSDGTAYQLPTAMYFLASNGISSAAVRDIALGAAKLTGKNFWVITTDYNEAAWILNSVERA